MAITETSTLAQQPVPVPADGAPDRLDFIDNLRWSIIVLVVSMHAAVTYSQLGSWYFMEEPKPGQIETLLFAYYQMGLQAFFMGLLFLVAGYFVPSAFERKGATRFLRDRFVRLCLPAFFYMLVIHPFIVFVLLRNYYQITTPIGSDYLHYLCSLRVLSGSGPMWFTLALYLFCLGYAAFRSLAARAAPLVPTGSLPTHAQVAGLVLVMGLCSFLVRIVQPIGTSILNMQLCFFSQYILLFSLGVVACRRNWLLRIRARFGLRWFWLALVIGSAIWAVVIVAAVTTHKETSVTGGFTWQSAAVCFWEAFFCVGICLGLLVWFRERFNRTGRFAKWMSDNCFSVYLFHAPILIAVTLVMHHWFAPKLMKFLVASVLGVALSYLASHFIFRRIPLLKRIL